MLPMTSLRALALAPAAFGSGSLNRLAGYAFGSSAPISAAQAMTTVADHSASQATEAARKGAAVAEFNRTHHAHNPEDHRGHGPALHHQPSVGNCAKNREFVRMVDPVPPNQARDEDESAAQKGARDTPDSESGYLASS